MILRRIFSVFAVFLLTAMCLGLFVPLGVIFLVISIYPPLRTLPHVWAFVTTYLIYECLGVTRLGWVWLIGRNREDYTERNREVQIWWASALLHAGARIFGLRFETDGREALEGPSALVFIRHTSIGDTVLPFVYYVQPRGNEGIRYIIKKELRISPSLDIGAGRLNTIFIDRSGINSEAELNALGELVAATPDDESILIYPEGTRQTAAKRQRLIDHHPELADQLARWPDLLPPRLGGVRAMLEHNPGKDAVFIAHTGFEGSANLKELLSGTWRGMTIRIRTWRVPYAEIASDAQRFVFEQWDRMQKEVTDLQNKQA